MYVAVKGGERAIENAQTLLAETRRGDPAVHLGGVVATHHGLEGAVLISHCSGPVVSGVGWSGSELLEPG